jgi:hypothetical protein
MPDEVLLRAKARAAIQSGKLPTRTPDRTWEGPGADARERTSEGDTAPAPTGTRRMRLASENAQSPHAPDALRPGPRVNHDLNLYPED